MAFVFSLAAVLAIRQQTEQQQERLLTAILHELAAARDTVHRIEDELRKVRTDRVHAAPQNLQAVSLHERYARIRVLEEGHTEMLARVAEMEARRNAQQQIYLAARRDRDLLEELESRQRASFAVEASRREQKRMDDLFLARRLRS